MSEREPVSGTVPQKWQRAIAQYLTEVEPLNGEPARSLRFGILLRDVLGREPGFIEDYVSGVEQYLKVKQKDRIIKGRADNLFGNVVIEFEAKIPEHRSDAEEQLRRYVAILWSKESPDQRTPYLCIATDGVRFITYSPVLVSRTAKDVLPEDVCLNVLEEADWRELKHYEVFYWLDRYFLRKEVFAPTSDRIVRDFGLNSHAFRTIANALLAVWEEVKAGSAFSVIYSNWEKYLRIVYGSEVAGEELFVRHTYLATLAKLMSWMRLTESTSLPPNAKIVQMLEGRLFKAQGIENFVEEDFFSWLVRPEAHEVALEVVHRLFSLLRNYDLRQLSEDVFKSLYQELVDPESRHDLGEYYTPDWLAHRIVRKLLDDNPRGVMLDPACGSGTFLYLAIGEKRQRLGDSQDTLAHILQSVYGADIHPLAVTIAKTNYLLALGDLLKKRAGTITIPVYLADTLRLPERETRLTLERPLPSYRVELDGRTIYLPEHLLDDLTLYDQAIELVKEFAHENRNRDISLERFRNFLQVQHFAVTDDQPLTLALFSIAETLKEFVDEDRDTIWAFVLKNIYKPLFFRQKFDFVMGNPPWIAYRYMEPTYQRFLKREITKEYKLLTSRGELITQLEVGTLFLVRAADLYLKRGGSIAFLLPRSVFTADQHDGLRNRTFRLRHSMKYYLPWRKIWDLDRIAPLFNVPACVVIAQKMRRDEDDEIGYPVPGEILTGELPRKNAALSEAEEALAVERVSFSLHVRAKRSFWHTEKATRLLGESYYKPRFFLGATIFPRSFWFVQVRRSLLGFNAECPPLETDPRAIKMAKPPYRDVRLEGNVESRFLYATLLSTDLLPFGHLDYRLIVLPIEPEGTHYKLVDAAEANERGFIHLRGWLNKADTEWQEQRGAKAARMSIYERLNRWNGLTRQNRAAKYRVIYNTSGTYLTAAVVETEPIQFQINGQDITVGEFLADYKTYYFETPDTSEAHYLSAILNAPEVDALIKPMQSRGLWGPRDICKKVLDLPIPQFDADDPRHQRLAELGQECSARVEEWLASGGPGKTKSIGKLRGMVRDLLRTQLDEIDDLVKKILE